MKSYTLKKKIAVIAAIHIAHLLFFGGLIYFLHRFELIVETLDSITYANLFPQLLFHLASMLIFPLAVIICFRDMPTDIGFVTKNMWICLILLLIYGGFFFLAEERTAGLLFKYLYCLLSVGLGEELFFRGWSYLHLKEYNPWIAIIISGFFFGLAHAIYPGILAEKPIMQIMADSLFGFGDVSVTALGGIVGAALFVVLLEWSGNLLVPILIHALLNFSSCLPSSLQWISGAVLVAVMCILAVKRKTIEKKPLFQF